MTDPFDLDAVADLLRDGNEIHLAYDVKRLAFVVSVRTRLGVRFKRVYADNALLTNPAYANGAADAIAAAITASNRPSPSPAGN